MKDFLKKKAICVRVSESEHEIITSRALKAKLHVSKYLRDIILNFLKGDNNHGK